MEPNELTFSDARNRRRGRVRLTEASAEDQHTAAKVDEAQNETIARTAAKHSERLGALIVAVANRINRISDLSTVLIAAARHKKDDVAVAALAESPSPKNDNVK